MKIGLLDVGSKNFPNLALMKLSAWHKGQGDSVEFATMFEHYDVIYKSKVFTWTEDPLYCYQADKIVTGGTGYRDYGTCLPPEIEHIMPDYSLYPHFPYSVGFATRGCIRKCPWCVVPRKEGLIQKNADIYEFWMKGSDGIIFIDNNIFAARGHFETIAEQLIREKVRADFNQGMDIRLLTPERAALLKRMRPVKQWRFSLDDIKDKDLFIEKAQLLKQAKIPDANVSVYVLVGFKNTIDQDIEKVFIVKQLGFDPFVMKYRDFEKVIKHDETIIRLWQKCTLPAWCKKEYKAQKTLADFNRWVKEKPVDRDTFKCRKDGEQQKMFLT